MPELVEELSAARDEYPDLGVVIRGDAKGAFENVARVLSACRTAGVTEMGISVKVSGGTMR